MEDRIVVEGKVYFIKTLKEKNTNLTHITLEENGKETELLTITHKKGKKEKLMKFHKKVLSFFFQALQDNKPISEEMFQKLEGDDTPSVEKDETLAKDHQKFHDVCTTVLHKETFACFVLKDNDLLNYIREDMHLVETDELIVQISTMIDFIRDNKNIDTLVGKWNMVVNAYEMYQVYCTLIDGNSILVLVSSRKLPIGSMIKVNEEIKEVIEKEFFEQVG